MLGFEDVLKILIGGGGFFDFKFKREVVAAMRAWHMEVGLCAALVGLPGDVVRGVRREVHELELKATEFLGALEGELDGMGLGCLIALVLDDLRSFADVDDALCAATGGGVGIDALEHNEAAGHLHGELAEFGGIEGLVDPQGVVFFDQCAEPFLGDLDAEPVLGIPQDEGGHGAVRDAIGEDENAAGGLADL